jgi:hypothetical protein
MTAGVLSGRVSNLQSSDGKQLVGPIQVQPLQRQSKQAKYG